MEIESEHDEGEGEVGESLVELSGVTGDVVDLLEDECPWQVGGFSDDFGIHEISDSDGACRGGSGDGDVVEHGPDVDFGVSAVEVEGDHESERSTVGCQSGVSGVFPGAVGEFVEG